MILANEAAAHIGEHTESQAAAESRSSTDHAVSTQLIIRLEADLSPSDAVDACAL